MLNYIPGLSYIYNSAVYAAQTGCPLRALALEYQDDPQVYALETASYEYMFGDSMLVVNGLFWVRSMLPTRRKVD